MNDKNMIFVKSRTGMSCPIIVNTSQISSCSKCIYYLMQECWDAGKVCSFYESKKAKI